MTLAERSSASERMDTDCVDFADYHRCLRDLSRVNLVTMTHRPMLAWLRRQVGPAEPFTLLDVGCGYGDALRAIRRRWPQARLTGVDRNPWSVRAAQEATPVDARIRFDVANVFEYEPADPPDFIISAQFTHHLTDDQIVAFIGWMEQRARRGWFIGDLQRHALAYYGFGLLAWAARWHPFVRSDGRISIARSFRKPEWTSLRRRAGLHDGAVTVHWHVPFRLSVQRVR